MKITSVNLNVLAVRRSQYPTDNKPEFLLVGRSNVGKSSFINTMINRKNYAKTSSNPGKTQTINFYLVNDEFYLVDAPGYGYANLSKERQKKFGLMMEDYLTSRENLKHVFMLVDFRNKPSKDDVMMYNFLKHYKIPVTIIATKTDKVGITQHIKHRNMILKELDLVVGDDFVMFSSISSPMPSNIAEGFCDFVRCSAALSAIEIVPEESGASIVISPLKTSVPLLTRLSATSDAAPEASIVTVAPSATATCPAKTAESIAIVPLSRRTLWPDA